MNNACCRLITVLLVIIFVLGTMPLVAMAVHREETAESAELGFGIAATEVAEAAVDWGFEGLALLLSACGALVRQIFRFKNG